MSTITTERYWDCNCKTNYIHPKSEEGCSRCGAYWQNNADQPDSRVDELYPPQDDGVCLVPCDHYKDLYRAAQATQIPDQLSREEIEKHLGQKIDDQKYEYVLGYLADELGKLLDFLFSNGLVSKYANMCGGEFLNDSD